MKRLTHFILCCLCLWLSACGSSEEYVYDFTEFRQEQPRSILVLPPLNHTTDLEIYDHFMATISIPIAEKGFYVFPANNVRQYMQDQGILDPALLDDIRVKRFAELFDADAVLKTTIQDIYKPLIGMDGARIQYEMALFSTQSGELLWHRTYRYEYDSGPNFTIAANNFFFSSWAAQLLVELVASALVRDLPHLHYLVSNGSFETTLPLLSGPYKNTDPDLYQNKPRAYRSYFVELADAQKEAEKQKAHDDSVTMNENKLPQLQDEEVLPQLQPKTEISPQESFQTGESEELDAPEAFSTDEKALENDGVPEIEPEEESSLDRLLRELEVEQQKLDQAIESE